MMERAPNAMPPTDSPTRALPTLHEFFAPGGILAQSPLPYEYRPGQLEMAKAVERALGERRHLIVEAGTGTGKTLAYLLPALRTGQRVIVSTGTKALQDQLYFRDVPFLETLVGELRVCYMKGRANYLCRHKLTALRDQPILTGLEEIDQYRQISRLGAGDGNRRPRGVIRNAGVERAVAEAGRAQRGLPGIDLPGLSPLLYYRDAAQGSRIGHHHCQSPSVLRRSGRQTRGRGRARRRHSAGGSRGDLRRGA